MKRVIVTSKQQAAIAEGPDPKAKEDWVVVKVHVAPMCTEYKAFAEGKNQDHFGHEAAGEVVEIAQPGKVKVGDRVVVMPGNPCGKCAYCLDGEYIHCQDGVDFAAFHGSRHGSATMAQYLVKQDLDARPHSRWDLVRTRRYGLLRPGAYLWGVSKNASG